MATTPHTTPIIMPCFLSSAFGTGAVELVLLVVLAASVSSVVLVAFVPPAATGRGIAPAAAIGLKFGGSVAGGGGVGAGVATTSSIVVDGAGVAPGVGAAVAPAGVGLAAGVGDGDAPAAPASSAILTPTG